MDIRGTRWSGWKLERLRVLKRISATNFAKQAGITRAFLYNIERDKSVPSVEVAARVALALGIAIKDLLE